MKPPAEYRVFMTRVIQGKSGQIESRLDVRMPASSKEAAGEIAAELYPDWHIGCVVVVA